MTYIMYCASSHLPKGGVISLVFFSLVFKDLVSFAYLCVLYSCLPFVAMVITFLISAQLFSFEFIILCI